MYTFGRSLKTWVARSYMYTLYRYIYIYIYTYRRYGLQLWEVVKHQKLHTISRSLIDLDRLSNIFSLQDKPCISNLCLVQIWASAFKHPGVWYGLSP